MHVHVQQPEGKPQVTTPEPPPEAKLITALREDMVPPLSMREAGRRAGMSATTWTQNEQGHRKVAPGVTIPIRATAEKLARMALVVGAKPEQLAATAGGQPPEDRERIQRAAGILQKLIDAGPDPGDQLEAALRSSSGLTEAQKRVLIDLVRQNRP